jgi:phosphate transport system permease protein
MAVSAETLVSVDTPIRIDPGYARVDRIFHGSTRVVATAVLLVFGSIGVFLGIQAIPTFQRYGIHFLTRSVFNPELNRIGILGTLVGTFEVAAVALLIAFPLALATALFISEYSPRRYRLFFVALVDLMAAVPSIVYGLWGALLLEPQAKLVSRWIAQNLGWIPVFRVNADANSPTWAQSRFIGSAFIAGICVSMMVIPIACSVMQAVFSQAPVGEREAAYALGATRWGVIRTVVIPFGRGGIIGGTMLGLGRALGETIAVLLIISQAYGVSFRVLQAGTSTISSLIAGNFGEATGAQLKALLTAGFVLFLLTLLVNTIAAMFVGRSRSGAVTDI